jgi:CHAD domain-containing protein
MAKAKEITGLDCAADALEWAATVLRVRFDEVIELRGAALDFSDIEGVHQMRVAARRLRSALRDFLPLMKRRPLRRVRKKLKEIADALGAVRDQDVAILALENLQSAAAIDQINEEIKEGIEKLLEERRRLREREQMNLIQVLDSGGLAKLQANFTAALDKAVRKRKRMRVISFNEAGREAVAASLRELCDLGASVYKPFNVEKLHEMRIAAKRLRYAVELFTACWGERVAPFAARIAEMQSFLGEVHDCDVWLENLSVRLRGRRNDAAATTSEYKADVWLLSEFIKNRTKNYRAALKLWSEWEATDFTKNMRAIIYDR